MQSKSSTTTIAAIATPAGIGGVGIVRISGPNALKIAQNFHIKNIKPRYTYYTNFTAKDGTTIDQGLLIYFKAPNSFTGEDVIELHGHGGPMVMDLLLKRVLELGAELARPGEFSERAFLNGKIDLTQAEAIADLINAVSEDAAHLAINSLQGQFSKLINELLKQLTQIRIQIEAGIDFPDEELSLDDIQNLNSKLDNIAKQLNKIKISAKQGELMREGVNLVIVGAPNVGKSSLINLFTGQETAIVTDIAGTTRDLLKAFVVIDGLPIKILDTAGLQETHDVVEKEGIRRALSAVNQADHILLVCDATQKIATQQALNWLQKFFPDNPNITKNVTIIYNKIDLTDIAAHKERVDNIDTLFISAKTNNGFDELKQHIKNRFGFQQSNQGIFLARRRHLQALTATEKYIQHAQTELKPVAPQLELVAENLRLAQNNLGEITGKFSSDDLLGKIFSEFCIGK